MTKMIGSTLPLFLLLLVGSVRSQTTAAPEAQPDDSVPDQASIISIPLQMRAGKFEGPPASSATSDPATAPDMFNKHFDMCGTYNVAPTGTEYGAAFELVYSPASSFGIRTDCTPHPERIVVSSEATSSLKDAAASSPAALADLGKCMGTFTCAKAPFAPTNIGVGGQLMTFVAPTAITTNDVCGSHGNKVIFSNEGSCAKDTDYGIAASSEQRSISRWMGTFKRHHIIRPFLYSGLGEPIKPDILPWTNAFLMFDSNSDGKKPASVPSGYQWKQCDGTCDRGRILKFNMHPGSWRMMFYLKSISQGFKLCVQAEAQADAGSMPLCRRSAEIYVLPQQGIVVWPGNGRSSLLQMKTANFGSNDNFAIEVGYGLRDYVTNGKVPSEFYVGNSYREYVSSDGIKLSGEAASKVSVFLSSDSDLTVGGGVVVQNSDSGETLVPEAEAPNVQSFPPKNSGAGIGTDGTEDVKKDDFLTFEKIPSTTTAKPDTMAYALGDILNADNKSDALYTPGKWWTWGIFIGFIIGSLLGMAIIGGIFYVLRRTVYGFWYRGMYKRYGCDASGTTGGITGIGFGQTTTGAITLSKTAADRGGTTAMTGMTTGGTTGGGTTGGKTSSSSTTGSTIAM